MEFEMDLVLKNGREVSVVAVACIDYRCECCDKPHLEDVDYTSVIDVHTGLDVVIDDAVREQLDLEANDVVYDELEEAS